MQEPNRKMVFSARKIKTIANLVDGELIIPKNVIFKMIFQFF